MKLLFRLFLSLSFLLVGGHTNIYANQYSDFTYHVPAPILEKSANTGFRALLDGQASTVSFSSYRADQSFNDIYAEETEVETKDKTTSKKQITAGNYFIGFYPRLLNYFSSNIKECSFSAERHFYYASFRCTLYQVFRI